MYVDIMIVLIVRIVFEKHSKRRHENFTDSQLDLS